MKTLFRIPATAIAVFITLNYVTDRTYMTFLIAWLGYALLCLGLLKVNQIKEIRASKKLKYV